VSAAPLFTLGVPILLKWGLSRLNYGIIDLGSNTIRLSIYRGESKDFKLLLTKKSTAGLSGEVVDGRLSDAGIEKACAVLRRFKDILTGFGIAHYSAFATASLRNIKNTEQARQRIEDATGIQIDLLSGEEEARLGFVGAARTIDADSGLFVDIGGGSTELLSFRGRAVTTALSMPIGSLNLFIRYVSALLPTKKEMQLIRGEVLAELEKAGVSGAYKQADIYWVGGTARAARKLYNDYYALSDGNQAMQCAQFNTLLQAYKSNVKAMSHRILRLSPERIHTIIPGMVILKTVAKICKSKCIIVSGYGLREGYLFDRALGVTNDNGNLDG